MFEEIKQSGVTAKTPENIYLGAGTIHKGLTYGDVYVLTTEKPSNWTSGYTSYYTKSGTIYTAVPSGSGTAPTWAAETYYSKATGWNFAESLYCATSGGGKITITPELIDVDVDGVLVKAKGLTIKHGEKAIAEFNAVEIKPEMIADMLIADDVTSDIAGYNEITSRPAIAAGDYVTGFGYIGRTLGGKPIVIVFDNALCTSGMELEGKDKEAAKPKMTFECYADLTADADKLPWHIYYPTPGN